MDSEDDMTRLKRKERRREKWVFFDRTKTRRERNSMGLRGVHIGRKKESREMWEAGDVLTTQNIAEEAKGRGSVSVLWTLLYA